MTDSPNLDDKGLRRVASYCKQEGIGLVIIDTLSLAKSVPPSEASANVYDVDYQTIYPLHRFALDNDLAIIAITHTPKNTNTSVENRVNGTSAITGAAGGYMFLNKTGPRGEEVYTWEIGGRTVAEAECNLSFTDGVWGRRSYRNPDDPTERQQAVLILFHTLDTTEITTADAFGLGFWRDRRATTKYLSRMVKAGLLVRVKNGLFRLPEEQAAEALVA